MNDAPVSHHGAIGLSRAAMVHGARSAAPLALAAGCFAATLGVLASTRDVSMSELALMSTLVFAGAAQVVAVELWDPVLPVVGIVLATLAINSRHLLMSATLAPWLNGLPPWKALLCWFFIVDESWALSMARIRAGHRDAGFLLGAGLSLYLCWVTGTLLGHGFGSLVPDPRVLGLDFIGIAVFVSLLTLFRPGPRDLLPMAITVAVTLLTASMLPGKWNVLAGAVLGASVASAGRRRDD